MKKILIATALSLAMISTASAATQFRGAATVVAETAQCAAAGFGFGVGNVFIGRWRPRLLGTNPDRDLISVFGRTIAVNFRLLSASFGTTFQVAQNTVLASDSVRYNSQTRMTGRWPATLTTSSNFTRFKLTIKRFSNVPQCTIIFQFTLNRQEP